MKIIYFGSEAKFTSILTNTGGWQEINVSPEEFNEVVLLDDDYFSEPDSALFMTRGREVLIFRGRIL